MLVAAGIDDEEADLKMFKNAAMIEALRTRIVRISWSFSHDFGIGLLRSL
jgi:hypothetical protein